MDKPNDKSTREMTRRGFVKQAGMAAGGGWLLSHLPVGASAHAGGSDRLRVAVVGCGGRGSGAANQALTADSGAVLVAMADAFEDRLTQSYERLEEQWGPTGQLDVPEERRFVGFDGYREAIDLADVVILATPPGFRPEHFEYAVNAGKHIFMEKPVATDAPGVRKVLEMANVAKQKRLNVVVGLQRHYQNNYRESYRRIRQQEIGRILSGQVYWNSGGVWVRDREPGMSEMEYQMRNWYYFTWLCGDHILEQHIHNIDVANWFIGEYPATAQGMGGREVRVGPEFGEIFDHHFVEYTYPGGAVISSQCRHQPGCMNRISETFQGTRATITTDGSNVAILKDLNGTVHYEHDGREDPDPYQQEHIELFASIRSGQVISDGENGAKSTMAALMGRMATYSGQVISWEEALNGQKKRVPDRLSWEVTPPVLPGPDGIYPAPVPGEYQSA
ncbi:MAG: Gfo/Idh/MocA family oxidoreductase [Balneolaceae bacterium]